MTDQVNELRQIGNRLSSCRQNRNMTQEELAGRLGITPQALSKWERGVSLPDVFMLAELSRLLKISTDYLLGVENTGAQTSDIPLEIGNNLRSSLEPLELMFGENLVTLFMDDSCMERIAQIRNHLSLEGILMPIVRVRDYLALDKQEFMVISHQNVLHDGHIETVDENALEYIMKKLHECVREKYYEILNPDLIKTLTDNLRLSYPALIDGVVPERIPYHLLTRVAKIIVSHGDSILFLPKIIELTDCLLWENPRMSADELAGQIMQELERKDNLSIYLAKRKEALT